tara:strand:- start:593 stop:1654 length:1062 start_codon:yes stop_codon:yes gene_type:complete
LKPKVVSLFSGCGGLDLGFSKAGFEIVFSSDNWQIAADTLFQNKKKSQEIVCCDVGEINFKKLKRKHKCIDVLIGGPPCPPFSKSRFYRANMPRAMEDDEAIHTLSHYFRAIKELKPNCFVFENVPGFVYKSHKESKEYFIKESIDLGYQLIHDGVINCANFGVPQIRERYFAIGMKKSIKKPYSFPKQTHTNPLKHNQQNDLFGESLNPWVTCKEVIGEFDYKLDTDELAGSKHKDLLKLIPPGDNYLFLTEKRGFKDPKFVWRSRYWSFLLKLSPSKPSWTIQASFSNNQGPFHWSNRFLRIEEIKRIQTFPDDYLLTGKFKDQWRQIGNAVPPLMAEVIAKSIKKQILFK